MKKTILAIALMAVTLIATSAYDRSVVGIEKGEFAPEMTLENTDGTITLDDLRGEYVLLTFWSSADADSRVQCNKYSAWAAANPGVHHIAVNFDANPSLFDEIVTRDGLNAKAQFNVQGAQAEAIAEAYHLASGYGSVLIDRDGRIATYNPQKAELTSL